MAGRDRSVRVAYSTAVVIVGTMAAAPSGLVAQVSSDGGGPEFGAHLVALHQDDYYSGGWSPGIGFSVRVPLLGSNAGQLSISEAYTRRLNEQHCPDSQDCPSPRRIAGGTSTLVASIGARFPPGALIGFTGLGYGRTWDHQSSGLLEYGGPTWSWQVSAQRALRPDFGLEIGYRILRMSWDNDYGSVLQGVRMTHHQISLGVTYSPWSDAR